MQTKRYVYIGVGALLLIILIVVASIVIRNSSTSGSDDPQAIFVTPEFTSTPDTSATTTPSPTAVTTQTANGDIWVVKQVKIGVVEKEGFRYDVYLFRNEVSGATVEASCMQPKWPAPIVADRYFRNSADVLIPCGLQSPCVSGDFDSPLQRFLIIK